MLKIPLQSFYSKLVPQSCHNKPRNVWPIYENYHHWSENRGFGVVTRLDLVWWSSWSLWLRYRGNMLLFRAGRSYEWTLSFLCFSQNHLGHLWIRWPQTHKNNLFRALKSMERLFIGSCCLFEKEFFLASDSYIPQKFRCLGDISFQRTTMASLRRTWVQRRLWKDYWRTVSSQAYFKKFESIAGYSCTEKLGLLGPKRFLSSHSILKECLDFSAGYQKWFVANSRLTFEPRISSWVAIVKTKL